MIDIFQRKCLTVQWRTVYLFYECFFLSVVPIATLMKRKTVDVQVEYLPEEKIKTPSPHNTLKFSRQVSLPANQMSSRFFRQRMNSMPGDSASGKKNGRFHLTLWFVDPVNTLSHASLNTIKRQTKSMDIYAWVESLLYSFII